ncbi:hypothetical protein DFQ28_005971 [Apophysomyces sp. BC1034]|nr:hypothetical protein DFQ30_006025 [Apophysomyces sp. BC1015]KAG0182706.1 hypothetical protein DFQ29_002626 [Apophysomyces sp. BC1021]KAG0187678.1 hypothetical protein DFQ28_005971 [Apophysomyces sp. BC1034]
MTNRFKKSKVKFYNPPPNDTVTRRHKSAQPLPRVEEGPAPSWSSPIISLPPTPISPLPPPPRKNAKRDRACSVGTQIPLSQSLTSSALIHLSLDVEHDQIQKSSTVTEIDPNETNNENRTSCQSDISRAFYSGTLGHPRLHEDALAPLPDSALTRSVSSPSSSSSITTTDDDNRLPLKERRRRRSPLMIPDNDRLTLALKQLSRPDRPETSEVTAAVKPRSKHTVENDDLAWRQRLLEKSLIYSFEKKDGSRQKQDSRKKNQNVKMVAMNPIAHVGHLEGQLRAVSISDDDHKLVGPTMDLVRDKEQYEAIVARTMCQRRRPRAESFPTTPLDQPSASGRQHRGTNQGLQIISEQRLAATDEGAVMLVPPTPPSTAQPQANARTPSLIYYPSSPSSVGSVNNQDYLDQTTHEHLHVPSR